MGARNVGAALALYPSISHRAMRLLVAMALQALDPEPDGRGDDGRSCRSYMGRDALAESLGYRMGSLASKNTRYSEVKAVLAELRAAGAVELIVSGAGGRRSEYLLRLDPLQRGGVRPPQIQGKGGRETPPLGGRETPPLGGREPPPLGGRETPPKEDRGGQRRNTEEDITSSSSSHLAAAPAVDNPEIDAARTGLAALGPDRQQAYLSRAAREGLTSTQAIMLRAHELATAGKR